MNINDLRTWLHSLGKGEVDSSILSGSTRISHDPVKKPSVGCLDTLTEGNGRGPAEGHDARNVEQLARRAVGLARVEAKRALEPDDLRDQLGELADGQILAGADVDVRSSPNSARADGRSASARSSTCRNSRRGVPGAPDRRSRRRPAVLASCALRIRAGRTWLDVEIEIVAGAVEIGRHRRDEIAAVLRADRPGRA